MNEQSRIEGDRTLTRLPRAELERRWALVRTEMQKRGIEALIALSAEDFLAGHVRWLTDRPAYSGNQTVAIFHVDDGMTLIEHGPFGKERRPVTDEPDYPGVNEIIS